MRKEISNILLLFNNRFSILIIDRRALNCHISIDCNVLRVYTRLKHDSSFPIEWCSESTDFGLELLQNRCNNCIL